MAVSGNSSADAIPDLAAKTQQFLGLKLIILVAVIFLAIIVTILLIVFLCFRRASRNRSRTIILKHRSGKIPLVSKEISVVKASDLALRSEKIEIVQDILESKKEKGKLEQEEAIKVVEVGGGKTMSKSEGEGSEVSGGGRSEGSASSSTTVEDPNIGWGRWYSLREVEAATRWFAEENVIGEGGYGIVYRGTLQDGSVVAVKNLLNNKYASNS